MAEAQLTGPPSDEGDGPLIDIQLTPEDRDSFLLAVAQAFSDPQTHGHILNAIGFPRRRMPAYVGDAEIVWGLTFEEFDNGIMTVPYRRLLSAVLRRYGSNPVFTDLHQRYLQPPVTTED